MDSAAVSSLIAAGAALAGVVLSQVLPLLAAYFERKQKARLLQLGKLEAMADLMNESLRISRETQGTFAAISAQTPDDPVRPDAAPPNKRAKSPNSELSTSIVPMSHIHVAQRMYTLSLLYLPDLKPFSYEFLQASMCLPMSAREQQSESGDKALTRFHTAQKALDDQMAACAERYLR